MTSYRNVHHVNPGESCCCNHPLGNSPVAPWTCCLVWPLGGIAGLILGWYGFHRFQDGIHGVNQQIQDLGLNLEIGGNDFLPIIEESWVLIVIVVGNAAVCLYGFREKIRMRFNQLQHISSCPAAATKCLVKAFVHALIILSVLVVIVFTVIAEAVYIVVLVSEAACTEGSEAVKQVIETLNQYHLLDDSKDDFALQNEIDSICSTVRKAEEFSLNSVIGIGLALIGQIIILAYWMKYSTLGVSAPFELQKYPQNQALRKKELKKGGSRFEGNQSISQDIQPALVEGGEVELGNM